MMDLSLAFATGLLSSLHCAGMCGPLVLAYSSRDGKEPSSLLRSITSHVFYNTGRILSYGFVGGLLGFFGGSIGALRGIGVVFTGLVGAATILFAVHVLRGGSFISPNDADRPKGIGGRFLGMYRASFGGLISRSTFESRFYIGLLTPLLPCGLLYGMIIRSAGAGNALDGASMMIAFGAGIVPALVAAGLVGSFLTATTRRWADRIAAGLLLLMGASLIWRTVMVALP